jgi:hypothetical protein
MMSVTISARQRATTLGRSLLIPFLCILPAVAVLTVAAWATKNVPSYNNEGIQASLDKRLRRPISNDQANSNAQTNSNTQANSNAQANSNTQANSNSQRVGAAPLRRSKNSSTRTNSNTQANRNGQANSNNQASPGLSNKRPETEQEYVAERQRIIQQKHQAVSSANRNAGSYDTELALLDAEKKDTDERHNEVSGLFNKNTGRISWGSYTIAYLSICAVAAAAAIFFIWKVLGQSPGLAAENTPPPAALSVGWRLALCFAVVSISAAAGYFLASNVSNFWEIRGVVSEPMKKDWAYALKYTSYFPMLMLSVGFLFAIACAAMTWALPEFGGEPGKSTPPPDNPPPDNPPAPALPPAKPDDPAPKPPDDPAPKPADAAKAKEESGGAAADAKADAPVKEGPPAKADDQGAKPSTPAGDNNQGAVAPADENLNRLRRRVRMLRIILYLAAAVLVSKVLQSQALVGWAMSYFDLFGIDTAFDNFRKSVITQEGLGYTIFLLAIYVPAFNVLRERAIQLAESKIASGASSQTSPADFLEQNGLTFSFKDQATRIVTILSPMLVSSVSTVLSGLFH